MPNPKNDRLSVEDLRERVEYDPVSGRFTHALSRGPAVKGNPTGTRKANGYTSLTVKGVEVLAHRAAWALTYGDWPDGCLDHISLDKNDNRIANLRLASATQNRANTPVHKNNLLGVKGVHRTKQGRFRAAIKVAGKTKALGVVDSVEEAADLYDGAAKRYFGDYGRGDKRGCNAPADGYTIALATSPTPEATPSSDLARQFAHYDVN
jgi:hypothetical protein